MHFNYLTKWKFSFIVSIVLFWDMVSCWPQTFCVAEVGLELLSLLPPPPNFWDHSQMLPCLAKFFILVCLHRWLSLVFVVIIQHMKNLARHCSIWLWFQHLRGRGMRLKSSTPVSATKEVWGQHETISQNKKIMQILIPTQSESPHLLFFPQSCPQKENACARPRCLLRASVSDHAWTLPQLLADRSSFPTEAL